MGVGPVLVDIEIVDRGTPVAAVRSASRVPGLGERISLYTALQGRIRYRVVDLDNTCEVSGDPDNRDYQERVKIVEVALDQEVLDDEVNPPPAPKQGGMSVLAEIVLVHGGRSIGTIRAASYVPTRGERVSLYTGFDGRKRYRVQDVDNAYAVAPEANDPDVFEELAKTVVVERDQADFQQA